MESPNTVLLEERPAPHVALLRLHRPAQLNALNLALRHALANAFTRLEADAEVRVIVLAGSERAFCAGADLTEYVDASAIMVAERHMGRLWDNIAQCRKPVIAAVRGFALGGGCELAQHTDIIVAGEGARLAQPEVSIGLMPGGGATQRLTKALGKFRAMQLLLTGAPVTAAEALALGMVSEVQPDVMVEPRAITLATQLAAGPQLAIQLIKEAVLAADSQALEQGLLLERRMFQLLFATADKTEGIRARLEKRPAVFK
ncbi:enoyl-CoA hydratase-related protein [Variovorax sp. HJSM1_2]|uniref:enoyl-CoA hydratase-related protein n=1 Tax=Variovorax sp. HJSM1_2 TaxID=3366263 RepID=UPI003BBE99F1